MCNYCRKHNSCNPSLKRDIGESVRYMDEIQHVARASGVRVPAKRKRGF